MGRSGAICVIVYDTPPISGTTSGRLAQRAATRRRELLRRPPPAESDESLDHDKSLDHYGQMPPAAQVGALRDPAVTCSRVAAFAIAASGTSCARFGKRRLRDRLQERVMRLGYDLEDLDVAEPFFQLNPPRRSHD